MVHQMDAMSDAIVERARHSDIADAGVQIGLNIAQSALLLPSLPTMAPCDNPGAVAALRARIATLRAERVGTTRAYALWDDRTSSMVEFCDANCPFQLVLCKGYDLKRPYEHVDLALDGRSFHLSNGVPPHEYVSLLRSLDLHVIPFHNKNVINFQIYPPTIEVVD